MHSVWSVFFIFTLVFLFQVFVNFAKQKLRGEESIVLHPRAAGARRQVKVAPLKR